MAQLNVELYVPIGEGRETSSYQKTIVYKGRVKDTIEFVAVKVYDAARMDEVVQAGQFHMHAKHRNIVEFMEWYQSTSKIYVVVEYCPGGTLQELLDRDVSLPETVIRIFAADILAAILYIHKHGYLYHDFSPRNMLLNECGILKLSDFTNCGRTEEPFTFPAEGVMDMLEYMPIEMIDDIAVPSYVSDLYSLGCLMYKMACGTTPFYSEDHNEIISLIKGSKPEPLPEMSKEFNDIVMKMMARNPYDRPSWQEILAHPFWADALTDRLDDDFTHFNPKDLPLQPLFEANRGASKQETRKSSASSILKSLNISTSFKLSPVKRTPQKETKEKTEKKVETDNRETILQLISDSDLIKASPVVFNPTIESFPVKEYDGVQLPVTPAMLKTSDPEELNHTIARVMDALTGPDRAKSKSPLLSFFIVQSKIAEVANNLINSKIFPELLVLAQSTKHPSLAAGFLLLYGSLIRHATNIDAEAVKSASFAPLETLASNPQEKIARKAVSAIGQIATTFIAIEREDIPTFTASVILKALRASDEPVRHYALRSLANIIMSPVFASMFDPQQVEEFLLDFDLGQSPYLLETYAITLVAFYKFNKPKRADGIQTISRNLLMRQSAVCQTLGIILGAETGTLASIKENILNILKNSSGEPKLKALLAVCIIFQQSPSEFIDVAPRFFQILEKTQAETPKVFEAVLTWSAEFSEFIVERVLEGASCEILQIVEEAIQIRPFCTRIWTKKFEKRLRKVIRNSTFTAPKSESAIQIAHSALCFQNCDPSIVADLCRALNSQQATVRFTVVNLVADASLQRPIHTAVMQFAESNIMSQLTPLLHDEKMIVDQTLRILANVCSENPSLITSIAKPQITELILNRTHDNSSALQLATQLISSGMSNINALISARVVPAIISAMDKKENLSSAIDLLYATLKSIDEQLTTITQATARRNFLKTIHPLATMASKAASVIFDYPVSAKCISIIVRIFTPQGKENEVLIESAFNPIASAIVLGCKKPEHASELAEVVNSLKWAAERSPACRLRLKGSAKLTQALKKAAEQGTEEFSAAAHACQQAIRG